jgi:glycosyltransferase involved in cell wall biosynthesis
MLGLLETPSVKDDLTVDLSIVVPIFNEEGNIPDLLRRLTSVVQPITPHYEIVAIDDGSRDRSWSLLEEAARKDPHMKVISFSRNFGHQVAITAGMEAALGETVIVIDADLQDPPELIPELLHKSKEGFDVVYAVRRKRDGESWAKLFTARWFYRIIKKLTHIDIPVDTGDFRLLTRRALNAFLAMPERHRFIRGMVSWV